MPVENGRFVGYGYGLTIGQTVRVTFDNRGLATIIDREDGMYEVRYLPDPERTTEYAQTDGTEWFAPADVVPV
jgi:hypothetical protein